MTIFIETTTRTFYSFKVLESYGKNGWIRGVNDACTALEEFMRSDDAIEGVWLRVDCAPKLPVRCFDGFRVDDKYLVKEMSVGKKKLTAAMQVMVCGIPFAAPW